MILVTAMQFFIPPVVALRRKKKMIDSFGAQTYCKVAITQCQGGRGGGWCMCRMRSTCFSLEGDSTTADISGEEGSALLREIIEDSGVR